MAPLTPHWTQPSHPEIQEVLFAAAGDESFTTRSVSRVALPPFALFAPMASPPVSPAAAPTYATVQVGRDRHVHLNSDLLYINHSCEPSLIFDTASRNIWVGPNGLRPGDELTFFYPSTEWDMAQPFDCLCGHATCRGRIAGARSMTREQLAGRWLNAHIWELLAEQEAARVDGRGQTARPENGTSVHADANTGTDTTQQALEDVLARAEETLAKADEAAEAARRALVAYRGSRSNFGNKLAAANGSKSGTNGHHYAHDQSAEDTSVAAVNGATRRGPTSRELSGEMGGDTART